MVIQLRLTSRELLERLSAAQLLAVRRVGIKTLFEIRAAVPYTPATPGVRVLNELHAYHDNIPEFWQDKEALAKEAERLTRGSPTVAIEHVRQAIDALAPCCSSPSRAAAHAADPGPHSARGARIPPGATRIPERSIRDTAGADNRERMRADAVAVAIEHVRQALDARELASQE